MMRWWLTYRASGAESLRRIPDPAGARGAVRHRAHLGLNAHPTKASDIPAEMGHAVRWTPSSRALIGVDRDRRERSAPVVMLEQR